MSRIWKVWQEVWVHREGTREWSSATVLSAVHPTEGPWRVKLANRDEMWVHKGHVVGSLAEIRDAMERIMSARVTAEPFPGHDFTEDDEPMGEVPDLPPAGWGGVLPESAFEHGHTFPPPVHPLEHTVLSTDGCVSRWNGTEWESTPVDINGSVIVGGIPKKEFARGGIIPANRIDIHTLTEKEPDVRQNPDAPVTMGVPGDHYTQDKVSYPQEQRRDALAQAYDILATAGLEAVDIQVGEAIRLAEYIVAGVDYADTPRSIHAEALRTETDAAVDVAVSKLLDGKAA